MSKNHMEEVAKMLGVELGEVFRIEDPDRELYDFFKITEDGLYFSHKSEPYNWGLSPHFQSLIRGEIEIKKLPRKPATRKPAIGDMYCYPDPTNPILWGTCSWRDDVVDNYRFQHGLIFATREDAIAVAEEMANHGKGKKNDN